MNEQSLSAAALTGVRDRIGELFGSWTRETALSKMRADFERLLRSDRPAHIEEFRVDGIPVCRVSPLKGNQEYLILYCHGGGYQMGSCLSHRDLMIRLADAVGCSVVGFDYRLAPENRFPAAVEDAFATYRWLAQVSPANRIAIAGDSAGGGLAVATLLEARRSDLPMPAAAVLLSPWLDMRAKGATYTSRAHLDPFTQREKVFLMARAYLGRDGDPDDPLASPLCADLHGLPPMLVHVGDHETILDDSRSFAVKAKEQGVALEMKIWNRMIHHFQIFPELPEAQQSIAEIATFLNAAWGRTTG